MATSTFAFVLATLCLASSVQSSPYRKCANGPAPLSLNINGCSKFPCLLKKGTTVHAEWDFTVIANTATLKPRVRATALGATVDYPLPQQDACKSLKNGECPLDRGERITYALAMPITNVYPNVALTIEFALIDQHGQAQVCFQVDAKVVKNAAKEALEISDYSANLNEPSDDGQE